LSAWRAGRHGLAIGIKSRPIGKRQRDERVARRHCNSLGRNSPARRRDRVTGSARVGDVDHNHKRFSAGRRGRIGGVAEGRSQNDHIGAGGHLLQRSVEDRPRRAPLPKPAAGGRPRSTESEHSDAVEIDQTRARPGSNSRVTPTQGRCAPVAQAGKPHVCAFTRFARDASFERRRRVSRTV
jgi:hypothetical protein